ncbi:MAG: 23S rRNA (adenine(1618)-N(6))-methyltransferase RlmF [Bacteroidia bacterium]|nr:23S rRNA (adenine(1618)-N(6))-methyltransferase RlmF [Bacteroidia bacterium]
MQPKKKIQAAEKQGFHPRNKHGARYDFKSLIATCPELAAFVKLNEYGDESIDFFDPEAVKMLNKALLKHYYDIENWDIPKNYLCPPIPGRAEYIHQVADLLLSDNAGFQKDKHFPGERISCLDIGVGANCVYPIIGIKEYGWHFVGADIDITALESAQKIIEANPFLKEKLDLQLQPNKRNIFQDIILEDEQFDISICNPPFHSSLQEAQAGTVRKLKNLTQKKVSKPVLNFGGQSNELWCEGGEEKFITDMIWQSKKFAQSCLWFTTWVSKESNLRSISRLLNKLEAVEVRTINMELGNKKSRIVAWTFLPPAQQKKWKKERWGVDGK